MLTPAFALHFEILLSRAKQKVNIWFYWVIRIALATAVCTFAFTALLTSALARHAMFLRVEQKLSGIN
jgi:hypothetical protein